MKLTGTPSYLRCHGTPYKIGLLQGRTYDQLIQFTWHRVRRKFYNHSPRALTRQIRFLTAQIKRRFPEELDEVQGIADGAGLDFDQAFLLYRHLGTAMHCTAVAFERSPLGPIGAAHLDDEPIYFIKDTHIPGQFHYLMPAWPGTLGGSDGMNEHGLTILQTSGWPNSKFSKRPHLPKFLTDNYTVAARILRSCRTVLEAVAFLRRKDIGGHGNHVLMDPSGTVVCVEKAMHMKGQIRRPDRNGFLFAVNCFLSEYTTAKRRRILDNDKQNGDRVRVLERYQQAISRGQRTTLGYLKRIMRNQETKTGNWPISNCQTVISLVAIPNRRELQMADGPPHLGKYQSYFVRAD